MHQQPVYTHPQVPWVVYQATPQGGYVATNTRTGERAYAPDELSLNQFAADSARDPGSVGAGDVFKTIAGWFGAKQCAPCAARQAAMNRAAPNLWRK
jgi:hypothetical protein